MSADPKSPSRTRKYNVGDMIAEKYRLTKTLGEGGMGEVWEAQNTRLDAAVAIKLIRAELDDPSASDRLLQEARAAARLGHPAIVRVFDVGETRFKDPFIVMERLCGSSLGDMVDRQGRLAAASAVQVMLPIADALATAHLKGIVHRDIKPENIFIAEDETGELQPKLLDFGVVKFENADSPSRLTELGKVVGSPDYLSPEQARGIEEVDYRVDIWAFSVVLYQLITGSCPFKGSNYNALLRSIVEDDPVPTTAHAAGDTDLWSAIERGLRKDRDERWPSMLEFGRALAQWALSRGVDEDVCGTGLELKWLGVGSSPSRKSRESIHFEDTEASSAIRAGLGRRFRDLGRTIRDSQEPAPTFQPAPPAEKKGYRKVAPWFAAGLAVVGAAWGATTLVGKGDQNVQPATNAAVPFSRPQGQSTPPAAARLEPSASPTVKPIASASNRLLVNPQLGAAPSSGVPPVEAVRPRPAERRNTAATRATKPTVRAEPKPKPTAKPLDKLDLKSPY